MIKVLWCHLVVTCKNDSRQLHCFCINMTQFTVNSYFGWTETEFKKFLHQAVSRLCAFLEIMRDRWKIKHTSQFSIV